MQVKANKAASFDGGLQEQHVTALVGGLIASSRNQLLCLALVDAVAALVAEPENCNTPDAVQTCAPPFFPPDAANSTLADAPRCESPSQDAPGRAGTLCGC